MKFRVEWFTEGKWHSKEFDASRSASLFARLHGGDVLELVPGLGWIVA